MSRKKKVIVYQMGKVASSSIKLSLDRVDGLDVIHAHHLNVEYTQELNEIKKSMGWEVRAKLERVKDLFSEVSGEDRLIIITLVREPVGRNISAYFQNLDAIFRKEDAHRELSYAELLDGFVNRYPHVIPVDWYDRELKEVLGIDVYQYKFPKKEGALIIREGRCQVLVMRYDVEDSIKERYVNNLLGINNVAISRENVGARKCYNEAYRNFLERIRLPDTYLMDMLGSRYARHFFDASELERIKYKWGRAKNIVGGQEG